MQPSVSLVLCCSFAVAMSLLVVCSQPGKFWTFPFLQQIVSSLYAECLWLSFNLAEDLFEKVFFFFRRKFSFPKTPKNQQPNCLDPHPHLVKRHLSYLHINSIYLIGWFLDTSGNMLEVKGVNARTYLFCVLYYFYLVLISLMVCLFIFTLTAFLSFVLWKNRVHCYKRLRIKWAVSDELIPVIHTCLCSTVAFCCICQEGRQHLAHRAGEIHVKTVAVLKDKAGFPSWYVQSPGTIWLLVVTEAEVCGSLIYSSWTFPLPHTFAHSLCRQLSSKPASHDNLMHHWANN